jgi:hypothetical protein
VAAVADYVDTSDNDNGVNDDNEGALAPQFSDMRIYHVSVDCLLLMVRANKRNMQEYCDNGGRTALVRLVGHAAYR